MMRQFTRRQLLTIASGFIFAVVVIFLLTLGGGIPTETLYVHDTGAILKHGVATATKDEALLVATNRNFVKYDPVAGTTVLLMNDGQLPGITNVKWSPDQSKALFLTTGQTGDDVLGAFLQHQNKQISANSWWVADFSKKTYEPVDAQITDAGWIDNGSLYITGSPNGQNAIGFYTLKLGSSNFSQIIGDAGILSAHPIKNGYLLYSSVKQQGVLTKVDNSGKNPQTIAKGLTSAPQFNETGNLVAALIDKSNKIAEDADLVPSDLVIIDSSTGKTLKTLAKEQTGYGAWSGTGTTYYYKETKSQQIAKASVASNKISVSFLKADKLPGLSVAKFLATPSGTIYLFDSSEKLFIGSTKLRSNLPAVKSNTVNGAIGINDDGYSIYYYASKNTYAIAVSGTPIEAYRQKALDRLRTSGVNPDLLDIVYDFENTPAQSRN